MSISNPNQLNPKKKKKKIRFQHHTNMNPQPLIIRTQGHNNKKFGKMNLYEAFQQAASVPQKKEQNWYFTSAEMLPTLRWKEVAAKRWWWWWTKRERERERERAPKMKIENEKLFVFSVFTFTEPVQFFKSKFEFQQRFNVFGLMEVKVCIVFLVTWRVSWPCNPDHLIISPEFVYTHTHIYIYIYIYNL